MSLKENSFLTPVVLRHNLEKFLMSSAGKISQSNILIREKSMWNYRFLGCLQPVWAQPLTKRSCNISSLSANAFFLFEQCQKVITQTLRIVLTVSCHSLSFILTTSGIQPWIHEFSPFSLFLKEVGDGWVYQRIQPWIDFCFALSFASWLCQMQCVSHAVPLFREPWLGWLVSIQKQAKEDKILLPGLLRLQISN